jgi:hypothetical protein
MAEPGDPGIVRVMWDYEAFPLWADHEENRLSAGLRADLQRWSDELTELMSASLGAGGNLDGSAVEPLVTNGRRLAERVAAELGPETQVTYFNELTRESERIEPPPSWTGGPTHSG